MCLGSLTKPRVAGASHIPAFPGAGGDSNYWLFNTEAGMAWDANAPSGEDAEDSSEYADWLANGHPGMYGP